MADDLMRVGLVFKADGTTDFKKSIAAVNTAVQENNNAFKLAKAAYDENTTAMEKLQDRQKFVAKQTELYSDKVNILQQELKTLESAEERNEQAIRKKHAQLTQAQVTLTKYQKELQTTTKSLENGTAAMEDELENLSQTMGNLSAQAKENETAYATLKSGYDENTKSVKKYADQQEYLRNQTKNYESQIGALERQLELLESAEDRNERAISEKRSELNQAKTALNTYKNSLNEVEKGLKSGSFALEDFGNKAKNTGEKLSGVSTAAAGVIGAVAATVPATEEYRKIMGSLEVSSEAAGYSAEQTTESYKLLYGVLGDDQTAATTTANLQALGLSQQDLTAMINGTIGAWAKYGDSIPIDGLAESINETAKVGQVTGNLADVLNWASGEEEAFNQKLAMCSTESERVNLIMQEMANQGLMQVGQKWQENNKNLVEGNQATADFQAATAELAETVAPVITMLTEVAAGLIEKFTSLPPEIQTVIGTAVALVAVIGPLITGIGNVSKGIGVLTPLLKGLWAVMKANPVAAVVTIIGTLITILVTAYQKCEWFRDGVNAIWDGLMSGINWIKEQLGNAIDWINDKLDWVKDKVSDLPVIGGLFSGRSIQPEIMQPPQIETRWFAKGGILNRPTMFARNGNTEYWGGEPETGGEAILPINLLKNYIREENRINNCVLAGLIKEAIQELKLVTENNIYIGDRKLETVLTEMVLKRMSSGIRNKQMVKGRQYVSRCGI